MIIFIYILLYCHKVMRKPIIIGAMIVVATTATVFASVRSGMSVPFVSDVPEKIETSFEKIDDATQQPPTLTQEQKQKVLETAKNDPRIKPILDAATWQPLLVGPWTEDDQLLGGVVLIRLDKAVWSQGEFGIPGAESYRASMWIGNMHVYVDLQKNTVVGIEPGVGRPAGQTPTDQSIEDAKMVALTRAIQELDRTDLEAKLLAVYHNSEFPRGAAFFAIVSDQGDEMAVGIDMTQNAVIEKYTAKAVQ